MPGEVVDLDSKKNRLFFLRFLKCRKLIPHFLLRDLLVAQDLICLQVCCLCTSLFRDKGGTGLAHRATSSNKRHGRSVYILLFLLKPFPESEKTILFLFLSFKNTTQMIFGGP